MGLKRQSDVKANELDETINFIKQQIESTQAKELQMEFTEKELLEQSAFDQIAKTENYHQLCVPFPRNVTRKTHPVYKGPHISDRHVTFLEILFQNIYMCTFAGIASEENN